MNIFKYLIVCVLTLGMCTTTSVFAQSVSGGQFKKVGAAGGQFLKIGVGARATGMAGAYSAIANDMSSIFWNPAGLASLSGTNADFSITQWFGGFSHNFAAASLPISETFTIGASFTNFSSGNIEFTTIEQPNGTGSFYSVNDISAAITVSGYLTKQFSFGVTSKYVQNSLASMNANGFAFDVGTMYNTGLKGIKLGFSVLNLGGNLSFAGQDVTLQRRLQENLQGNPQDLQLITNPYSLPLSFRAGISTDVVTEMINGKETTMGEIPDHYVVVGLDFETFSDTPEQISLGAEYMFNNMFMVRGGGRMGHDEFSVSGGAGFKYIGEGFKAQVDYSIAPTGRLGLVNRISIGVGFN